MKNHSSSSSPSKSHPSTSQADTSDEQRSLSSSRRGFLKGAGMGAAAITASALFPGAMVKKAEAVEISPFVSQPVHRAHDLEKIRQNAAKVAGDDLVASEPHPTNGDEETYAGSHFEGSFSKSFPLDANGLVNPNDYKILLAAAAAGTQAAWDAVPSGGPGKLAG